MLLPWVPCANRERTEVWTPDEELVPTPDIQLQIYAAGSVLRSGIHCQMICCESTSRRTALSASWAAISTAAADAAHSNRYC